MPSLSRNARQSAKKLMQTKQQSGWTSPESVFPICLKMMILFIFIFSSFGGGTKKIRK